MGQQRGTLEDLVVTMSPSKYGCWNIVDDPQIAKLSAKALDFLIIDLEHGFRDFSDFQAAYEATQNAKAEIYVRVRKYNDPWIQSLLDLGVTRFVLPQIRELSELDDFLQATSFPPTGRRGLHPRIFQLSGMSSATLQDVPNLKVHTCVIVETKESLKLIDAICSHPQVDEIYLGVYDLSLELGMEGGVDSPDMLTICSDISKVANKLSKPLMAMATSTLVMKQFHTMGVSKFVIGIDSSIFQESLETRIREFKDSGF